MQTSHRSVHEAKPALGGVRISLAAGAMLALFLGGCSRPQQPITERRIEPRTEQRRPTEDNQQVRQGAIDHARQSCVRTATAKAGQRPGEEAKIRTYCDCFATRGIGGFSNAELASVDFHNGQFTPQQKSKLTEVVQQCRREANATH